MDEAVGEGDREEEVMREGDREEEAELDECVEEDGLGAEEDNEELRKPVNVVRILPTSPA
jgi:hypothetical protein